MANNKRTLSIEELDGFDCCEKYDEIRSQIIAHCPDLTQQHSLQSLLKIGVKLSDIRDLLYPIARVAQADGEVQNLLTAFINDCQIRSLPAFEKAWPGDDRPRKAIEATADYLSGLIDFEAWQTQSMNGMRAWAGYFAPQPFIANGFWASVDRLSWRDVLKYQSDRFGEWVRWANWAVLALKCHLVCEASSKWTLGRLTEYLGKIDVPPLILRDPPNQHGGGPFSHAGFVDGFDLEWAFFIILPDGIRTLGSVGLDQNASFTCPVGVEKIKEIHAHRTSVELPPGIQEIGSISTYEGFVTVGDGLERIGHLTIDDTDCNTVSLPETVLSIAKLQLDSDYEVPASVQRIGEIIMDDPEKEANPADYDLEDGLFAAIRCGIRYEAPARDLRFD